MRFDFSMSEGLSCLSAKPLPRSPQRAEKTSPESLTSLRRAFLSAGERFSGEFSPEVAYIWIPFAPISAAFFIAELLSNLNDSRITPIGKLYM